MSLFEQAYQEEPRLWTALVEAAASLLLDPAHPDRTANARTVQRIFLRQPVELAYLLWYPPRYSWVEMLASLETARFTASLSRSVPRFLKGCSNNP